VVEDGSLPNEEETLALCHTVLSLTVELDEARRQVEVLRGALHGVVKHAVGWRGSCCPCEDDGEFCYAAFDISALPDTEETER